MNSRMNAIRVRINVAKGTVLFILFIALGFEYIFSGLMEIIQLDPELPAMVSAA